MELIEQSVSLIDDRYDMSVNDRKVVCEMGKEEFLERAKKMGYT